MSEIKVPPVSMCLIVKNEPLLEQCLESIRPFVKEIVIVDTGSTDDTPDIAKKYADIFEVYTGCNGQDPNDTENYEKIIDFSMARNRAFELATQDWVMWADADDIVEGLENLPKVIDWWEKNKGSYDAASFMYPYEYAYDVNGDCTCEHYRERLFTNKKHFSFLNAIHEVVVPNDGVKCLLTPRDDIRWKHKRQYGTKMPENGRNLRIMRKVIEKKGDSDIRQLYYYGLELSNAGLNDEAIFNLKKYVNLSGWSDEQAMATLKLVDIYSSKQDYKEALRWAMKTIELKHSWGEGYFAAARMFYFLALAGGHDEIDNWNRVAYFAKTGLSFPPTKTLLFINPLERECEIHKYLNMALNKLGDIQGALDSVIAGMRKQPTDTHFVNNKRLYQAFLARNQATIAINTLKDMNELDNNNYYELIALLNKQPISIYKHLMSNIEDNLLETSNTEIDTIEEEIPVRNINGLDIIFAIGDGIEEWTPQTFKKTGLGGSETAVVEMSKRLAKLGHKVRVYNSCGINGEKNYAGVEYYQTAKYKDLNCDILIISRNAQFIDDQYNIKAKLKLLWVHDVYAFNATNARLLKFDRILALSEWHKQNLIQSHNISSYQIIKTRNGIDLKRFENKNIKRDKYKCVISSSPDRYLPALLQMWSEIKRQVPKASLHIFYGLKNWEHSAQFQPGHKELIEQLKNKIFQLKSQDVIYRDRVDQQTLANEMLSAGALLYPTWFSETNFISGYEAQAAGLRIVSSPIAAINETVADRGTLIEGDWISQDYQKKFIDASIAALLKNDDSDRLELQEYAKNNFSWDQVSNDWDNMFKQLLDNKNTSPIIEYCPTANYR